MTQLAKTPSPPYYAVIFTSLRTEVDEDYAATSIKMLGLAQQIDGYLGVESAREELGITVSYWRDLKSIQNWKKQQDHLAAQALGKQKWYRSYSVRIAKVERDYEF
ncbi:MULTISPECIES: antibiotic biosynthesis monooxygenase family protein [Alteromonadaceae]|uniref:antibiotic biosynthesis monooxygenase family protein n=1 Tax=Alteromonadaceae TaxID=72275 RepID=UPI001C097F16|nr:MULTISPECIES: antibiotic biosynthesis monooxygenase [Aliiglaciecola]MBU2876372.1 antibiotic biosynthesis monooxygenase [Aliiglaciecola lipolytica]MDO6710588.1 antibiotic biosynthesis monooxygenase [Aliiglaciecola sp. 2_MG-2023]MDO6751547.1 antibiotic biosynthesis monooxygenase [Aliiglaciecola sp. 1_MG-2023]